MVERQRRLLEVYAHLHDHCGVHTQKDLAHILRYSRVYISSALNGNEKNLTDKLFKSICEAFPETFNLNYLLTGEGELLSDLELSNMQKHEMPPSEQTANILEIYANRIRLLDDMRTSLSEELAEIKAIKEELQQARDDFRLATARLSDTLHTLHLLNITSPLIAADEREAPENRENNA